MPHKPASNWGRVCPAHAPKPDPRFALVPPAWFAGRYVKLGFPCLARPELTEHVWVYVWGYLPDQTLLGVLDNDPVQFSRDEIEAVLEA